MQQLDPSLEFHLMNWMRTVSFLLNGDRLLARSLLAFFWTGIDGTPAGWSDISGAIDGLQGLEY